jgi:hypothetical protein
MRAVERADGRRLMTDAHAALAKLLKRAEDADPANRIDWRDPIAAHGAAAIEAVTPWLKVPALAAFAIRVIARVGLDGEREAAQATLRQARRRLDERLRADVDWALASLRVARPAPAPAVKRAPARSTRTERPRYSAGPRTPARRPSSGMTAP